MVQPEQMELFQEDEDYSLLGNLFKNLTTFISQRGKNINDIAYLKVIQII